MFHTGHALNQPLGKAVGAQTRRKPALVLYANAHVQQRSVSNTDQQGTDKQNGDFNKSTGVQPMLGSYQVCPGPSSDRQQSQTLSTKLHPRLGADRTVSHSSGKHVHTIFGFTVMHQSVLSQDNLCI